MSEWVRGSLGELASGVRGVSYTPNQLQKFMSPETVVLLRSNNIKGGQVNFDNIQLVPSYIVSSEQLAQHGDIAVCMSNGSKALVGKSGRIEGNEAPCTVGAFCSIFRPHAHADEKFVSYVFQWGAYRRHLDIILAGSAINNLKNSDVEALSLEIPPRKEQRLIATILDTLDTQIQKTEALIAKLEKVKEGLLHDLLTRGIDENGQLRHRPEQAPELYKESPLGLIPREWEVVGFLDAAELPSGQVSPLIEPYSSLPLIAPDHIESGTSKLIRTETARDQGAISGKYIVRPGDVVYSKIRPYLRKAWLAEIDSICSADMYPLRPKLLIPSILLRVVMSESFSTYANAASMRTGIPKINREELSGYTFALPTIQEQVRMENIFQEIERKVNKEREALSKLVSEKIGLMDDLLTGRVRVTPLLEKAQATSPA